MVALLSCFNVSLESSRLEPRSRGEGFSRSGPTESVSSSSPGLTMSPFHCLDRIWSRLGKRDVNNLNVFKAERKGFKAASLLKSGVLLLFLRFKAAGRLIVLICGYWGSLLVKEPKGIAIWNDYSLFKRTSILYGLSLKLARISSTVNEAVFFYGRFFFLSWSFLSITRGGERKKGQILTPSGEKKMVLVFYFPNPAATRGTRTSATHCFNLL